MYPFSSIVAKSLGKKNRKENQAGSFILACPNYFKGTCQERHDIPTEEPTAGINAGVSFVLVLPVSQHDVVTSKAYLPGGIDG